MEVERQNVIIYERRTKGGKVEPWRRWWRRRGVGRVWKKRKWKGRKSNVKRTEEKGIEAEEKERERKLWRRRTGE